MALKIKRCFDDLKNSWILSISGEIDIDSSNNLKDLLNEITEEKKANITLECSDLSFIDSTGLGVLISVLKRIKSDNHTIIIENPKQNIAKLLNITGLNKLFTVK